MTLCKTQDFTMTLSVTTTCLQVSAECSRGDKTKQSELSSAAGATETASEWTTTGVDRATETASEVTTTGDDRAHGDSETRDKLPATTSTDTAQAEATD